MRFLTLALFLSVHGAYAADLPAEHTVKPRDTLWDLAGFYYYDPFKWPFIAQANPPPKVKDPHWIYPKQVLRIPVFEPVQQAPKESVLPSPESPEQKPPEPPKRELPVEKPAYQPDQNGEMGAAFEGLSYRLPDGLVGLPPSSHRFKTKPQWKADGLVLGDVKEDKGWEHASAEGDTVDVQINAPLVVHARDRYLVMRKSAQTEADADPKAQYLSRVGLIEIRHHVSDRIYQALILRCDDTIQADDMIKRGGGR